VSDRTIGPEGAPRERVQQHKKWRRGDGCHDDPVGGRVRSSAGDPRGADARAQRCAGQFLSVGMRKPGRREPSAGP
jgi:hypothetical protein